MENRELPLIKEIRIENPPTYFQIKKKKKSIEAGKDVYDKYYLTSNLFFNNNVSYHIVSKIVQDVKKFLFGYMGGIPELEKIRVDMEFHSIKDIDLDNRWFFFYKLFLDILKTPSPKQLLNANKKRKEIITTNTIYDDNTKFVGGFKCEPYIGRQNMIVFRIYGKVKNQQKELDLFFK